MSSLEASDTPEARARAAREALVGATLAGRYALRRLVGHGGMGAVYEAEHLGLGKPVAVKLVDPEFATDERVVTRFAREARAMSVIDSPHIVTVLDVGAEKGRPFLVMELLRGEDLGERLRRLQRVPASDALHVVAQVLKGLAKAHAAGIVHRDLKPDNVFLVQRDTDPLFAKIVDFGVSKIERPRDKTSLLALTGRGTILGTPFYMPPEQAQALPDIDLRADLYSVGAILFECLTGRPPHPGETYEQVMLSICMSDAPDVRSIDPSIPGDVASFVARALSRDRMRRPESANHMLAALHEIMPLERHRVPLDVPLASLVSGGRLAASPAGVPFNGVETRRGGSLSEAAASHTPATLMSPGHGLPARTQTDGSPVVVVSVPPARARAEVSRDIPPSLRSSRRRSQTAIIATAILALITGVAAMIGVLTVFRKAPDVVEHEPAPSASARVLPPTITSGVTADSAPVAAPPSTPAVVSAPAPLAPSPKLAPKSKGGAKPAAPKLDISRDLP